MSPRAREDSVRPRLRSGAGPRCLNFTVRRPVSSMTQLYEPGESYWRLIDPYWLSLNESWDGGPEAFLAAFGSAPLKVQHLYACHWCQSEVTNGGFHQFFYNTTGLLAPEALIGFSAIGAGELATITAELMAQFGLSYPRDRTTRIDALEELLRRHKQLFAGSDGRFCAWMDLRPRRWELLADLYAKDA